MNGPTLSWLGAMLALISVAACSRSPAKLGGGGGNGGGGGVVGGGADLAMSPPGSGGPDGSSGGGKDSGVGGGGDLASGGGIPGDTTPSGPPTWSTQFVAADSSLFTMMSPGGQIQFGAADPAADDGLAATLLFPGSTTLLPGDHVGTAFATEIDAKGTFHYGMYRSRVRLAACASSEDVVNGNFTYFNDGTDHDGDGLIDNSEIDIEILCGTPTWLSLTIWSQYTDDTHFKKWTRAIDVSTGEYLESTAANTFDLVSKGKDPQFLHPSFHGADAFYEVGFEWHADRIRYFMIIDGKELTLWNFTNQALVPQLAGKWLFNVWHPATHWFGGNGAANYPAHDATMHLDWARYWKE